MIALQSIHYGCHHVRTRLVTVCATKNAFGDGGFFGLKGRFYQPSPKGWETTALRIPSLKGSFIRFTRFMNGPYRARGKFGFFPSPAGWADRNGLSGRMKNQSRLVTVSAAKNRLVTVNAARRRLGPRLCLGPHCPRGSASA